MWVQHAVLIVANNLIFVLFHLTKSKKKKKKKKKRKKEKLRYVTLCVRSQTDSEIHLRATVFTYFHSPQLLYSKIQMISNTKCGCTVMIICHAQHFLHERGAGSRLLLVPQNWLPKPWKTTHTHTRYLDVGCYCHNLNALDKKRNTGMAVKPGLICMLHMTNIISTYLQTEKRKKQLLMWAWNKGRWYLTKHPGLQNSIRYTHSYAATSRVSVTQLLHWHPSLPFYSPLWPVCGDFDLSVAGQ